MRPTRGAQAADAEVHAVAFAIGIATILPGHASELYAIAFADFSGNKQFVSAGNLMTDNRVALIMDYPRQARLKILGCVGHGHHGVIHVFLVGSRLRVLAGREGAVVDRDMMKSRNADLSDLICASLGLLDHRL